jgi:hypothetical protein
MGNPFEAIVESLRLDHDDTGKRLDSAAITNVTLFTERELTQVRNKVFETKYPELKAMGFIPIATDIDPDLDTYSYQIQDAYGQARIINKNDGHAIPMVSLGTREETGKVVDIGLGYGYQLSELRLANKLGKPLGMRLANAARRGHLFAIDELLRTGKLATTGQTANGLGGFCNSADVNTLSSGLTFTAWMSQGSTPDAIDIYNDLCRMYQSVSDATDSLYNVDTFLFAAKLYGVISNMPMFETGSETTVLQYFLRNHPGVSAASWGALNGTGDGTIGTSGYHQIIAYQRSADCLEGVVPLEFEQITPQANGFKVSVPCRSRCGGVKWYIPASARYGFVNHSTT